MAYENINFSQGLMDGFSTAFNLLDTVDQRNRRQVLQQRQDEQYAYDKNVLRPLRERELLSSVRYNESLRPKQLQMTDQRIAAGDIQNYVAGVTAGDRVQQVKNSALSGQLGNQYTLLTMPDRVQQVKNSADAGQLANRYNYLTMDDRVDAVGLRNDATRQSMTQGAEQHRVMIAGQEQNQRHSAQLQPYRIEQAKNSALSGQLGNQYTLLTMPDRVQQVSNSADAGQLANRYNYLTMGDRVQQAKNATRAQDQNIRKNDADYYYQEYARNKEQEQQRLVEAEALKQRSIELFANGDTDGGIALWEQADGIAGGIYGRMLNGEYGDYARAAKRVFTGEASPDDPAFKAGTRKFMEPTMKVTGRDGGYQAKGFRQSKDGRLVPTLTPITPETVGSTLDGIGVTGKTKDQLVATIPRIAKYEDHIEAMAAKYGVHEHLVKAVITQESVGDTKATSSAGAKGLMQLMPGTASDMGVSDSEDALQNIEGGVRYLSQQLKAQGGDVEKALAAYNAGPARVRQYGGVPPFKETQDYIKNVTQYAGIFGRLEVPATVGRSSDNGDPVVSYSPAQATQAIQQGAMQEQELLRQLPAGMARALRERAEAARRAAVPKTADWTETKEGGKLYNKRTREVVDIDGDTGKGQSLADYIEKNYDDMGGLNITGVANLIDKELGHLELNEKIPVLNEIRNKGELTEKTAQQFIRPIKVEQAATKMTNDFLNGNAGGEFLQSDDPRVRSIAQMQQATGDKARELVDKGWATSEDVREVIIDVLNETPEANRVALNEGIALRFKQLEQKGLEKLAQQDAARNSARARLQRAREANNDRRDSYGVVEAPVTQRRSNIDR